MQATTIPVRRAGGEHVLLVLVATFVETLSRTVGTAFDGSLGNDVLDRHVLVLDYPGRWLALE
jgi:hypothetical protein